MPRTRTLSSPRAAMFLVAATLLPAATGHAESALLSFRPVEPTDQAIAPAAAPAQSEPAAFAPVSDQDRIRIAIELSVWFVGPSGDLKLPVSSGTGPGSFTTEGDTLKINDLNLDTQRLRPKGAFRLSFGEWIVSFSGAEYSSSRTSTADVGGRLGNVAFAAGDRLDSNFSYGMYDAYVGYCVWNENFTADSADKASKDDIQLNLYILGGVRLHDIDISVARAGTRAEYSGLFAEPFAGARLEAALTENFGASLMLSAGGLPLGDQSSASVDIEVAFEYRPIPNLAIQLGYRQLAFFLSDGEGLEKFDYDGTLAGLFTGITLRF